MVLAIEHHDSEVVTIIGKNTYHKSEERPFNPWLFIDNPDYFTLLFDCIGEDNDRYEVIIDEHPLRTAYIRKKDRLFSFMTPEEFVMNWGSSGFDFQRNSNPLRKLPAENAAVINNEYLEKYKIWRVDAIKV